MNYIRRSKICKGSIGRNSLNLSFFHCQSTFYLNIYKCNISSDGRLCMYSEAVLFYFRKPAPFTSGSKSYTTVSPDETNQLLLVILSPSSEITIFFWYVFSSFQNSGNLSEAQHNIMQISSSIAREVPKVDLIWFGGRHDFIINGKNALNHSLTFPFCWKRCG